VPAFLTRTFGEFSAESITSVLGELAIGNAAAQFPIPPEQIDAWHYQFEPLQAALQQVITRWPAAKDWQVLLEYPIPRIGKRIDAVLLAHDIIIVLEFKTGESISSATRQVEDYAMLLNSFHEPSYNRLIAPVAVYRHPTQVGAVGVQTGEVAALSITSFEKLGATAISVFEKLGDLSSKQIDGHDWNAGKFKPTPTIIEAAVRLYSNMNVFEIWHACAAHESLELATNAIVRAVEWARESEAKLICFVTGVPGSGKTLIGLNAAHHEAFRDSTSFLSGNGPLVKVLKEALIRDTVSRTTTTRAKAKIQVETFIHNVHRFAEEYFKEARAPVQHVIVFDEAQRAWDREQNERRYKRECSEPEMLLDIMDRHADWSVIVALVGGGQEINRGEAGLPEWGRALEKRPGWNVWTSAAAVAGDTSVAGQRLFETSRATLTIVPDLHLNVSLRAIRSQHWSEWVNEVLAGNVTGAISLAAKLERPPLVARSISDARNYLRKVKRGSSRVGLVGSASAARLRVDGLEPSYDFHRFFDWEHWFLDDEQDVRSSSRLEVFATQFEIQGLELDWVCLCWGDDLIWDGSSWAGHKFNNRAWKPVTNPEKYRYLVNAYRVLLTRSRQGTVIYIPSVPLSDSTRKAKDLDNTADFLLQCGARPIERGEPHESGELRQSAAI
jgi:hypothetical protein